MPARLKQFEKAVLLADDNDRWLHKRPESRKLALTVAALGGMRIYRELMSVGSKLKYSPRMQEAYRTARRELAGSVALANRTRVERFMEGVGIKIVAALCRGYTSEVAEALRQDGTPGDSMEAVFLLYNLDDGRISLRKTPNCELDLARLAGRFGGGGHPAAAGFDLPEAGDHLQNYMLDRVGQVLES